MSHSLTYDLNSISGKATAHLTDTGVEQLVIENEYTSLTIHGGHDIAALRLMLNTMARTQERTLLASRQGGAND